MMLDENIRIWGAGDAIGVKPTPPKKYSSLENIVIICNSFLCK